MKIFSKIFLSTLTAIFILSSISEAKKEDVAAPKKTVHAKAPRPVL